MAKATVEIGAKTDGLKAGLQRSQQDVANWRKNVSSQIKQVKTDAAGNAANGGMAFLNPSKAIIGIAAVGAAVKSMADEVDELHDTADATGLSLNSLSKLGIIFGQGGVKATELRKVLVNLSTAQGEVIAGSTDAAKKFAALGISQEFVKKSSPEEVLESVTRAMAAQGTVQEAMSKGLPLLGSKNSRFAAAARNMGRDYKAAMDDVKGALTDADAKKIAETMDKIETAMKGAKNTLANFGGDAISRIEELAQTLGMITSGSGVSSDQNPMMANKGEIEAAAAKKKTDADSLAAQEKLEASAKAELESQEKLADAAKERESSIASLQDEQKSLYDSQIESAVELLSVEEKQNYWLMKHADALKSQNSAKGDALQYEQASLDASKAKAKLDEIRDAKVKSLAAKMAMSPEERAQSRREEKAAERRTGRARRTIESRERDAIDNQVRKGAMTREEAEARKNALKVDKKEGMTMDQKILGDIKGSVEKLASSVDRLSLL